MNFVERTYNDDNRLFHNFFTLTIYLPNLSDPPRLYVGFVTYHFTIDRYARRFFDLSESQILKKLLCHCLCRSPYYLSR